jgi:hypothetical protein
MSMTLPSILVVTALLAAPVPSHADVCSDLVAAWPAMQQRGTPLKVGASEVTYESLYDQCDTKDEFVGRPLPKHKREPLKCSTDPNRVSHLVTYADGTVSFEAKAGVDADGSRYACGDHWPNQCGTGLAFDRGSLRPDIDSEASAFVVVPTDAPGGPFFQKDAGIKPGDLAVVMWKGKCSFGVVGDMGPYFRLGEISLRSHAELGHERCKKPDQRPCRDIHDSSIARGVAYLIFPKSRPKPLTSQNVQEVSRSEGERRVREFLERYGQ